MGILLTILTLILQFVGGQLLGFGGAMALNAGNGMELVVIPLGNALGVWLVGMGMARIRNNEAWSTLWLRLVGALIGGGLGVGIILLTPPTGFGQLLYPLLGALLGYYVISFVATDAPQPA